MIVAVVDHRSLFYDIAAMRRGEGERNEKADTAGDHEDEADHVEVRVGNAGIYRERKNGPNCQQKYAYTDTHGYPLSAIADTRPEPWANDACSIV